jgi:hypothetical protein
MKKNLNKRIDEIEQRLNPPSDHVKINVSICECDGGFDTGKPHDKSCPCYSKDPDPDDRAIHIDINVDE